MILEFKKGLKFYLDAKTFKNFEVEEHLRKIV